VARARSNIRELAGAAVHQSAARRLVQPGLFERRPRRLPDAPLSVGGKDDDDSLSIEFRLCAVLHATNRSSRR
jgi:hypothetical protein